MGDMTDSWWVKRFVFLFVLLFPMLSAGASDHNSVPSYLVKSRLEKLDLQTPVSLQYNQYVQAYIDVYTKKRPEHLARILSRARLYFPLFEEYLDKYGLPLELKYLAVIESALDPKAKSSSGAYGLWQFLYQASRMFDLEITSYIDERADPVKSTDAACRYLKYLYDNFNDWLLAISAYNVGIGTIKAAIEQAGGERDYWKLRPFLPEQVRGYVPAFVAANYVMNFHHTYNIEPLPGGFHYDDLATTMVKGGLSFDQIARLTGISVDVLRLLNPVFKMDYIPVQNGLIRIVIPEDKVEIFNRKRSGFLTEEAPAPKKMQALGDTIGREKTWHIVKKGEFFHAIAMEYECRIEDLMYWNNLKNKQLYAGQKLVVWKPGEENAKNKLIKDIIDP
ncbi:transglycosylase SLT domain-containing protein [Thermophagus sp. OGC60D27]|uniref:transglycosylase SLT domain-containing protein n=1 Tax=Thermophagus sp. OGC60D27 TaxID=3458415 RepID=UPI0040379198